MNTKKIFITALATLCLTTIAVQSGQAQTENLPQHPLNTGNDVSMATGHPNFHGAFAPELPSMLARMPATNPETGLHVSEVKPGLFFVTEGVYQSAFLVTDEGVVVFDAPPSFAQKMYDSIGEYAPGKPIRFLVYSHSHSDHIGGASVFGNVEGLEIIAHSDVAQSIEKSRHQGMLALTMTFNAPFEFSLGGEKIVLTPASFHAEDTDTIVYLPRQKFVIAVDTITPGEVPFMNFGATADVGAYMTFFETILDYEFDFILSGHVSALGTRDDVIIAREYAQDVWHTVSADMIAFLDVFNATLAELEYKNANLAYRVTIETLRRRCATAVIDRWSEKLSVVDVWADSHCQSVILYKIMH